MSPYYSALQEVLWNLKKTAIELRDEYHRTSVLRFIRRKKLKSQVEILTDQYANGFQRFVKAQCLDFERGN